MNYITITNPNNIEIKYHLAGIGSRTGAAIIDTIIQIVIMGIIIVPGIILSAYSMEIQSVGLIGAALIILFFLIYFSYYIIFEYLSNGQTPGKKLLKLRTIAESGMPLTLGQTAIRSFFKSTVDIMGIGVVMIFMGKKNKRLGDYAASTVVISIGSYKPISYLDFTSKPLPSSLNIDLTAAEREAIKDYFLLKNSYRDGGKRLFNELAEYISKKYSIPQNTITEEGFYAANTLPKG